MQKARLTLRRELEGLVAFRRDLHAHPEPGFEEHRTAERIAEALASLPGTTVRTGVGKTGVVATLRGRADGPCLALRADMDALRMEETSGLPYASCTPGVAHACGHDGHVACLLGAARVLAECADELVGPVRFIFQPAEETFGGGRLMCEEGALDDPPAAAVFALHAWPHLSLGTIGFRSGVAMAAADRFDITVRGRGAHAATPHLSADPVLAAAHVVTALQAVVSRLTNPVEPSVVTVSQIAGGTAFNVIPNRVDLAGTIRSTSEKGRRELIEAIGSVAEHTARAFGATAELRIQDGGYPVTVNDPAASSYLARAASSVLGAARVRQDVPLSMGAEDFSYFLQRVPGAMWRLGCAPDDGSACPPLHHSAFDFPDAAIETGVLVHCATALRFGEWGQPS